MGATDPPRRRFITRSDVQDAAARGVEVVVLDDPECKRLMDEFIARYPDVWNEDIGEE